MGRYYKDLKRDVESVLRLYQVDTELREYIDALYFSDFAKYNGKLHIAIRHNIKNILEFIERREEV